MVHLRTPGLPRLTLSVAPARGCQFVQARAAAAVPRDAIRLTSAATLVAFAITTAAAS
jgi:hypothetical protein